MTNKEIAGFFNELAKMMELYDENQYRIRSYQNAYIQLRKQPRPLAEMSLSEMEGLKGIGKGTSTKIMDIISTGKLPALEAYRAKTPPGIQNMLRMKGFGPKKIKQLWKELGIESVGELWYACNENRLVELKGFGAKTQADLKKQVEYFQQSSGKYHYAAVLPKAEKLLALLEEKLEPQATSLVGEIRRYCPVVHEVAILVATDKMPEPLPELESMVVTQKKENLVEGSFEEVKFKLYFCAPDEFGSKQFRYTGSKDFIEAFLAKAAAKDFQNLSSEQAVFDKADIPYIAPELREEAEMVGLAQNGKMPSGLINSEDIRGVVHCHSTYSDGINSLEEMARYTRDQGFGYLAISDHSKSAFYANGMKPDRVLEQFAEIDQLNKKLAPFRIFKSIESDILNDGSLDYEDDLLAQFDFVIASVHSHLKMDEEKAMKRLITAVENPYTKILGHPTGRLLLSRPGYPVDHHELIDACAANGVAIELNANPYRLDLDYRWIPYALEKGVLISINPDAHSTAGIHDIRFGTFAARKGGLSAEDCLTAKKVSDFAEFVTAK